MNRDFSCEEHRENPPGSTSISDGRNVLGPEGSHTDCRSRIASPEGNESGHDFIVEVKVESEFIEDYSPFVKGEAHLGLLESYFQASQDALSNEHVKEEPRGSPPVKSSKAAELLNDFIVELKVESEFIDDSSSLVKGEAHLGTMETFQSYFQTSQDALSNENVKEEPRGSPPKESSKAAQLLDEKQMKLVSCSYCSQLFDPEVFNPDATRTVCQETDNVGIVSYNRTCKSCTETLENIQGSERSHKCSVCDKSFTVLSSLNLHQKTHKDEKPYKLSLPPKAFSQWIKFNEHQGMHAGEKTFKCSLCRKAYAHSSSLQVHQRSHTGEKPYNCSVRHKGFSHSHLHHHKRLHTGEKAYKCSACHKAFASKAILLTHQRIHTGERPYNCPVCLKSFNDTKTLKEHKRIHTGERPYKCSVCHKSYNCMKTFREHQRTHTGEKPYKCSVCDKSFSVLSSLKQHQRIHTGEKPHKCSVCDKSFTLLTTLKQHQRIHTGERPYKCSVCSKTYITLSAVKEHQIIHSRVKKKKPYQCPVCTKDFARSSAMKRHEKIHAGEKQRA